MDIIRNLYLHKYSVSSHTTRRDNDRLISFNFCFPLFDQHFSFSSSAIVVLTFTEKEMAEEQEVSFEMLQPSSSTVPQNKWNDDT